MSTKTHVIVVPFSAQGHVTPLLKLAYRIADHGIMVTFVITEFLHKTVISAVPEIVSGQQNLVRLVTVPDVLKSAELKDQCKLDETLFTVMPGHLKDLIEKINHSTDGVKITCVIADAAASWALQLAKKMGIKGVACFLAGLEVFAFTLHTPTLIRSGFLDVDGTPLTDSIPLSEDIPAWTPSELPWSIPGALESQKIVFKQYYSRINKTIEISEWLLINTFYDLEQSAHKLVPKVLSIGPLLTITQSGHFSGSFWPEDPTCLNWLDNQLESSVIYISFGSLANLGKKQFQELALGLELTNQPFLWVVRTDSTEGSRPEFPEGFIERVSDRGKIVAWCCQEKVLAHPATACFLSHCGWNSTIEGVSMGVPFLCWPFSVDQFHNTRSICETWKIGVQLKPGEDGVVTRHEIVAKVKTLLSGNAIKDNALKLKEKARESANEGGSSFKNFQCFIEKLKHQDL